MRRDFSEKMAFKVEYGFKYLICLQGGCKGKKRYCRGLCYTCYKLCSRHVVQGDITWNQLVINKVALPLKNDVINYNDVFVPFSTETPVVKKVGKYDHLFEEKQGGMNYNQYLAKHGYKPRRLK